MRTATQPPEPNRAPHHAPVLVATVGLDEATNQLVMTAAARVDGRRTSRLEPPASSGFFQTVEIEVEAFRDMNAARTAFERQSTRSVVLVTDGSVLRRRRSFPVDVFVIAVLGPDPNGEEIDADDYLRKPFEASDLTARLLAAVRHLASERRGTVRAVLREAVEAHRSGEVIVSLGAESARIHLDHGRIAWVHRTPQPTSIRALLAAWGAEVDEAAWRDVLEESRGSRRHFGDVLVEWGMIGRDQLRSALRQHLVVELGALVANPIATANFVQENRPFTSSLAFDEVEVMPHERRRIETRPEMRAIRASEFPPPSVQRALTWFERTSSIPDVLGCALVDPRTGEVVQRRGELDDRAVWSLVASFSALEDDGAEVVATSNRAAYLVRSAKPHASSVLAVRFDAKQLSPAMARLLVTKVSEDVPVEP